MVTGVLSVISGEFPTNLHPQIDGWTLFDGGEALPSPCYCRRMSERSWRRRWIQGSDGTLIELRSDKTQRRGRLAHGEVRLRPISEIKKRVTGDISKLNRRLLRASRRLQRTAKAHPAIRSVPGRIVISLFRKAVNTFEGIEILKRKRLIEEAWILLRVLLEAHVNLAYFLTHDPKEMVHRYLD